MSHVIVICCSHVPFESRRLNTAISGYVVSLLPERIRDSFSAEQNTFFRSQLLVQELASDEETRVEFIEKITDFLFEEQPEHVFFLLLEDANCAHRTGNQDALTVLIQHNLQTAGDWLESWMHSASGNIPGFENFTIERAVMTKEGTDYSFAPATPPVDSEVEYLFPSMGGTVGFA